MKVKELEDNIMDGYLREISLDYFLELFKVFLLPLFAGVEAFDRETRLV